MSKMNRKPKVEHDGVKYESNDGGVTYTPVDAPHPADDILDLLQRREDEAFRNLTNSGSSTTEHSASATEGCGFESRPECQPLAKVEVNDDTPRCPFCRSVKVEESPAMLPGFNRFKCNDCRKTFRAPTSERQRKAVA